MMLKFFKKAINRVLKKAVNMTQEKNGYVIDRFQSLKEQGNLEIGKDCLIEPSFNIFSHEFEKGVTNVVIGNNCHLMGTIELYSPTAKVTIGDRVFIGPNTKLFCHDSITIDDDVMISWGCTLIDTNAHSLKSSERKDDVINWKINYDKKNWTYVKDMALKIKAKSWIGFNTIITKGVTIEEGTVVGCGSVVTKSTDQYTIVGGNPATFIKNTE